MFLQGKRKGASFLIMVVIMALVMSMFAISASQLSRSRSSTLISDATERQVLYLAEDAVNQMILQLNVSRSTTSIGSPTLLIATELGANDRYRFEASYSTVKPFYPSSSGTVIGIAYLMDPSNLSDRSKAIYSKTVYLEVQETGSGLLTGVNRTWREDY